MADINIPWTKEGCESVKGTWVTAHSATDEGCDAAHCNGMNFCRSQNNQLNWWSALIWCKSIGRELADMESMCPNGLSSGNTCANLKGRIGGRDNWSINAKSERQHYCLNNGAYFTSYDNTMQLFALCK